MANILVINIMILLAIIFVVSWLFVALAVYFIPIIVAKIRNHNDVIAISILNIVLGWTFLGWLAALLWSLNSDIQKDMDIEE